MLSCDLLDGHLVADASAVCDDLLPGSTCGFWRTGSLMGVCEERDATPLGLVFPYVLSAMAIAEALHWLTEAAEWAGRNQREQAGTQWLSKNKRRS